MARKNTYIEAALRKCDIATVLDRVPNKGARPAMRAGETVAG